MGQSVITRISKIFDVGCGIKMWHFAAVLTVYFSKLTYWVFWCLSSLNNAQIHGLYCTRTTIIGAEDTFIAHSAERWLSIWKGISYHRPTGSHYRLLFQWLTPCCFVYARWETWEAEETVWRKAENEQQFRLIRDTLWKSLISLSFPVPIMLGFAFLSMWWPSSNTWKCVLEWDSDAIYCHTCCT